MAYNTEVLADSPVDYYQMETATGTDSGSGARTLTKTGITTGVAGKVGNAWSFNGTSDSASTGTWMGTLSAFTFEAWIKAPSAQGMTGDYHTIIRRDGTDVVLLRVRGSNITGNVNPGQLEAYIAGTTLVSGSAYRVDDGNWHHVAVTVNGTAATLYVDGVSRATATTSKSSYVLGTAAGYIGSANGTSEYFKGTIDEPAIYTTALSGTRITAHYNAGLGTNVTLDVSTLTASTNVYAVTTEVNTLTTSLTSNADRIDSGAQSATAMDINGHTGYINFDMSALAGATIVSATLGLQQTSSSTGTSTVSRVIGAWSEADVSGTSLNTSITATFANGLGAKSMDVKNLLQAIVDSGNFNGFGLTTSASGSTTIATKENTTAAYRPTLSVTYVPGPVVFDAATVTANAAVNAVTVEYAYTNDVSTLTASAQSNDVTVEGSADTSVSTVTASLSAYDVTVEVTTDPSVAIDAATLTASLATDEVVVAQSAPVDVSTVTVSADVSAVTVEQQSNAYIDLDTPSTFVTKIGLTDVNGTPIIPTEDEDPFYNSTRFLNPYIWYRMNATSGNKETPRIFGDAENDTTHDGTYYGVTIGLNNGPNGRKNVHFDGADYFVAGEALVAGSEGDEFYSANSTLQFSIRTTKKDQFVMRMDDSAAQYAAGYGTGVKDLYLKGGKLHMRIWQNSTPATYAYELLGYTDIADGNWHTVTLVSSLGGDELADGSALEGFSMWIDGELDRNRRNYRWPVAFPDYIGGRVAYPGLNDPKYNALPTSDWFVGDVSEVMLFHYALNQDQMHRQNDTVFGYDPVYADTAKVTVTQNEVIAKGNTKRVLVINIGARDGFMTGKTKEGHLSTVAFGGLPGGDLTHGITKGNHQFFAVSAYSGPYNAENRSNQWWEQKYDVSRMLDLTKDLNMADYDIVNVVGYPTTGNDWDDLDRKFSEWSAFGGPSARAQLENLMSQVREFAVNGGGLYVTDPSTAQAIGLIDHYEMVDLLEEPRENTFDNGTSRGTFDRRSAEVSPWKGGSGKNNIWNPRQPAFQLEPTVDYYRLAHFFRDLHANNWQTVRALVPGLTDIPGRIITDAVEFWPYLDDGYMYAEKAEKRDTGLNVGDTLPVMGTRGPGRGAQYAEQGISPSLTERVFGQIAAPVSNVKAGTVVTTFADTYWKRQASVDVPAVNPYKDYALSVVVQPGDTLNGEVVKGRIYMNFSEGFADVVEMMHAPVDQIPSDADLVGTPYIETEESRQWSYSMWRGGWAQSATGGATGSTTTIDPNGNVVITPSQNPNGDAQGISYTGRWPIAYEDAPTMYWRGLEWVGGDIADEANATVGLATLATSAAVNGVTVEAARSAEVAVDTVEVLTEAWDDQDTQGANVTVNVFTVTATAKAEPFTELVDLSTLAIAVQSYDDADGIVATSDMVVLRLPRPHAILTLEEK